MTLLNTPMPADKESEEWKDIVWYEWYYMVSSFGNIKWLVKGNVVKQYKEKTWYMTVCLYKDKNSKHTKTVHRLVAIAFLDNKLQLPQVNHKDWCKTNNAVTNLERCSMSDNMRHRYRTLLDVPWFKRSGCIRHPAEWTPPERFKRVKYILQYDLNWCLVRERCWIRPLCRDMDLNRDTLKVKLVNWTEYKWLVWKAKLPNDL